MRCKKNNGLEDKKKRKTHYHLHVNVEKHKFHSGLCKHKKICNIDEKI